MCLYLESFLLTLTFYLCFFFTKHRLSKILLVTHCNHNNSYVFYMLAYINIRTFCKAVFVLRKVKWKKQQQQTFNGQYSCVPLLFLYMFGKEKKIWKFTGNVELTLFHIKSIHFLCL